MLQTYKKKRMLQLFYHLLQIRKNVASAQSRTPRYLSAARYLPPFFWLCIKRGNCMITHYVISFIRTCMIIFIYNNLICRLQEVHCFSKLFILIGNCTIFISSLFTLHNLFYQSAAKTVCRCIFFSL